MTESDDSSEDDRNRAAAFVIAPATLKNFPGAPPPAPGRGYAPCTPSLKRGPYGAQDVR